MIKGRKREREGLGTRAIEGHKRALKAVLL